MRPVAWISAGLIAAALTELLAGGGKGWFSKTSYPGQTLPARPGYEAIDDYAEGWRTGDFDRMGSAIGPEFIFRGPMQSHDSKAAFMESCRQMAKNPFFQNGKMENVQRFVSGNVVALFYDFAPQTGKPISMAERMYLDDSGHIREIRLIFDPSQLA